MKRWVTFYAVGGLGIGVQFVVLLACTSGLRLDYLWATVLAVEAAVIHNFLWHERFTWADRRSRNNVARFVMFNLTTGMFSIAGNLALMALLVGALHLPYLGANGLSIAACSVANFLVSDRFVFRAECRS
jgi:putative flippase GtrA